MDPEAFKKYLHDRIKVNGKAGDLGSKVNITRDKSKLVVQAEMPFSKRYLKVRSLPSSLPYPSPPATPHHAIHRHKETKD